jgi:hypothetical protein
MLAVIRWQIGAPAADGDAQRSARHDHKRFLLSIFGGVVILLREADARLAIR